MRIPNWQLNCSLNVNCSLIFYIDIILGTNRTFFVADQIESLQIENRNLNAAKDELMGGMELKQQGQLIEKLNEELREKSEVLPI